MRSLLIVLTDPHIKTNMKFLNAKSDKNADSERDFSYHMFVLN